MSYYTGMDDIVFLGSADWTEEAFVREFESCEYPNANFKHSDHIRLAWIYIRRFGTVEAEKRIGASIRKFAVSLGHAEKYHETITRAWFRLVNAAYRTTPNAAEFAGFIGFHPWLLERTT